MTEAQEAALQWGPPGTSAPARPNPPPRPAPRLAPGYRWIAVRPGPPPPPRRKRRPLGPTPHYSVIPRWGLVDRFDPAAMAATAARPGPAVASVRTTLTVTRNVLGVAALLNVLIYVLLIVNRTMLLHPVVAGVPLWLSRLAALAAVVMVFVCAVRLTRWLIARREVAFSRQRLPDTRTAAQLWAGCLVPVVNLAWAPVYVLELAAREGRLKRLRKPIVVWWLVWAAATAAAVFAIATSGAQDAQGIGNNTVATVVADLLGLAAVVTAAKVFEGFERRGVQRPAHRWVVVADDDAPAKSDGATPADVLEPAGREPAA